MLPKKASLTLVLLLALSLVLAITSSMPAQAAAAEWTEVPNVLGVPGVTASRNCFDSSRPNTYLYAPDLGGTVSVDLLTGKETKLNSRTFYTCNPSAGFVYYGETYNDDAPFVLNLRDGKLTQIQYEARGFARDGSLWVYSDGQRIGNRNLDFRKLYASPDGGITWQERTLPELRDTWMVSPVNGRTVYFVSKTDESANWRYDFYASEDAGVSWQKRGSFKVGRSRGAIFFQSPEFLNSQANTILFYTVGESTSKFTQIASTDGGATFTASQQDPFDHLYLPYGMLYRMYDSKGNLAALEFSPDYGKAWFMRYPPELGKSEVKVLPGSPNTLIFNNSNTGNTYYSFDQGQNWRKLSLALGNFDKLQFSPYAPTIVIKTEDNGKVYRAELPELDASHTVATPARSHPDGIFFSETGHNLSPLFKRYWEANGGLAQFGYPKTEAFREYNPADGKIYTVQYFERNRFEYHPENRGTQYEVLLGLLGNQQTEKYRKEGNTAFNYFEDKKYPGGIYFPETGHNLRNAFKEYWEKNGGLAIYGYPTSEEFNEVNPDDGKTYVVQYFERNRFEWHPENKGTKYEVLLGLLGNALLRDKGWLPN
jgi:hypothetical protein